MPPPAPRTALQGLAAALPNGINTPRQPAPETPQAFLLKGKNGKAARAEGKRLGRGRELGQLEAHELKREGTENQDRKPV